MSKIKGTIIIEFDMDDPQRTQDLVNEVEMAIDSNASSADVISLRWVMTAEKTHTWSAF